MKYKSFLVGSFWIILAGFPALAEDWQGWVLKVQNATGGTEVGSRQGPISSRGTGVDFNAAFDQESGANLPGNFSELIGRSSEQSQQGGTIAYADTKSDTQSTNAANAISPQQADQQTQTLADELALNELHHVDQKEIALTELALKNSESEGIKGTARQINNDHHAFERQVDALAKERNIDLKSFSPATYEKVEMDRLSKLKGQSFDLAFMQQMQTSHKVAINQLRLTESKVKDPGIKGILNYSLKHMGQHENITTSALHQTQNEIQRGGQVTE